MSQSFQSVHQRLRNDRGRTSTLALCLALLFFCAWMAWAFLSRINRYEISDSARLEVHTAPVLVLSEDGARAQYEEANAQATLAEEQGRRATQLRSEGILSVADEQRAKASARSKRAAAESLRMAI